MARAGAGAAASHVATREARLPADATALLQTHAVTSMTFGAASMPAEVAMLHVLRALTRAPRSGCGSLGGAAQVSREWRALAEMLRAWRPACALDVRSQLRIRGGTAAGASAGGAAADDGEYMLYHEGDGARPMRLYVRNARSARPSEFLTLGAGAESNFSFFPAGGSAASSVAGGGVRTRFSRVRVDPWSLLVKTDDYTFATTDGAPLEMTYWNGARRVTFAAVPYATARDSLGSGCRAERGSRAGPVALPHRHGEALIDLSGTGFGVRVDGFRAMGCRAWGVVALPQYDAARAGAHVVRAVAERVRLAGGGFAGRLCPARDVTRDEAAGGHDFDHEGRNGGWVLPLVLLPDRGVPTVMQHMWKFHASGSAWPGIGFFAPPLIGQFPL